MGLDILKTKEMRGHVLRLLNEERLDELSESTIVLALISMGYSTNEKELHGEIKYLQDKGYVISRPVKPKNIFVKMTIWMVRITAKGKDLVEGSPPKGDPGIILNLE